MTENKFELRVQRDDRETVVISEGRMNSESRDHVENDKGYELANQKVTPSSIDSLRQDRRKMGE